MSGCRRAPRPARALQVARRGGAPRTPLPVPSQPAPERGQRADGSNLSSQETLSDFLAILPVPPATYPARPPRQEAGGKRRVLLQRSAPSQGDPGPGRLCPEIENCGAQGSGDPAFVRSWGMGMQPHPAWRPLCSLATSGQPGIGVLVLWAEAWSLGTKP